VKKILLLATVLVSGTLMAKTVGKVNGYSISQKDADRFVKQVTKGKLKFNSLKETDKKDVIMRLATDKLILKHAYKDTPVGQQQQIITNVWLRKKASREKVTDKEVKDAYNKNKNFFKDKKGKIVPFKKAKVMIKESLLERKAVARLMKKAKIVMGTKVISTPSKSKAPSKTAATTKSKKSSSKSNTGGGYTVVGGDTLSGIAKKNGTTTAKLRAVNGMQSNDVIKIGQKLKLP